MAMKEIVKKNQGQNNCEKRNCPSNCCLLELDEKNNYKTNCNVVEKEITSKEKRKNNCEEKDLLKQTLAKASHKSQKNKKFLLYVANKKEGLHFNFSKS